MACPEVNVDPRLRVLEEELDDDVRRDRAPDTAQLSIIPAGAR